MQFFTIFKVRARDPTILTQNDELIVKAFGRHETRVSVGYAGRAHATETTTTENIMALVRLQEIASGSS